MINNKLYFNKNIYVGIIILISVLFDFETALEYKDSL